MDRIALRKKNSDATLVSNSFIDDFMISANEAQIKIYLFLLRALGDNIPVTVSLLADTFNYTEKDVLRALVYWDKVGLLSIEFDYNNDVVGICVNECAKTVSYIERVNLSTEVPAKEEESTEMPQAKKFYSLEQMNSFKSQDGIADLITMTEHYVGKNLSISDIQSLLFMHDKLNFPVSLMEYLINYCVNGGNKSLHYMESVAIAWSEQGIKTVQEAKALSDNGKYRQECFAVLKAFGITGRTIVDSDVEAVTRWINDYGFSLDMILEACKRTIISISNPSFSYADGILKKWREKGIFTPADLVSSDEEHKKSSEDKIKPAIGKTVNKFKNFSERDDDYNAIGRMIMDKQIPLLKS